MIGTKIGNYKVVKQIGEGGMGAVYAAKHTLLDKMVAVKVLLPEYCSNEEVVSRFFNEAKATTMVDHPGIVELYDFGNLEDGRAYIVMEFLVGESLDARIASRPLPYTEAARIASRIAGIMRAAHSHDIVHRDLKPENIVLVPDPGVEERERPKVLDFGIAKLNDETGVEDKSKVKTRTGSIIGSPLYMSPEQCRGSGRVDYRSDIYSLGCILFELLCARPPFDGEGTGEIIGAHLHVEPEHPSDLVPSVPKGLSDIVLKSLAKVPAERFQSMDDFARALRKYCTATAGASTVNARPWGHESIDTPPPPSAHAATQLGQGPDKDGPVSGFGKTRTPMPTTLGLSTESGVAAPKPEGRNTVLTMLVVGAVAAAGLAYYQVSKVEDKAAVSAAAQPEAADTQAPQLPEAPPALSEVTLRIESVPAGAAIHQASDDALLGHTPFVLTKPASEEMLQLLLRHPGHDETTVDLSLQADVTKMVTLSATAALAAEGSEEPVAAAANKSEKAKAAKAKAAANKLAKAKAKAEAKAKAIAKAKAKAEAKAKTKTKNSPLTQPKAKTKRAGDGALDPFNM